MPNRRSVDIGNERQHREESFRLAQPVDHQMLAMIAPRDIRIGPEDHISDRDSIIVTFAPNPHRRTHSRDHIRCL
jgi:hypothetical protein